MEISKNAEILWNPSKNVTYVSYYCDFLSSFFSNVVCNCGDKANENPVNIITVKCVLPLSNYWLSKLQI